MIVLGGALVLLSTGAPTAHAAIETALAGGKPSLDTRLRYEKVEQDNAARDADALTLRARLGYQTGVWKDFDGFGEFEGVYAIGGDGGYNSGPGVLDTTNGRSQYSVIADPTGDELNRGWLRYRGWSDTEIKLGRQRIILDNARYIGNVGWRQDEQTLDALRVTHTGLAAVTLNYAYMWRQNFIFFNDNKLDAHALNIGWAAHPAITISAYAYLLDFDDDTGPRVPGTPDNQTIGIRAAGGVNGFSYVLEYADQSDYGDASSSVNAEYMLIELSCRIGPVTPLVGYEVLGGDGTYGFSTPLATLHAYQGWADIFLNTPATGIKDSYFKLSATAGKFKLAAVYHDFRADEGAMDFGSEIDLLVARPITQRFSLLAKYADYSADEFAVDTRRLWVQGEFKF